MAHVSNSAAPVEICETNDIMFSRRTFLMSSGGDGGAGAGRGGGQMGITERFKTRGEE